MPSIARRYTTLPPHARCGALQTAARRWWRRAVKVVSGLLLLFVLLTPVRAQDQVSYQLFGPVREICGAWLPGTRVTLSNSAGVTLVTRVSDPAGYSFSHVPGPGPWRLTAELPGFERLTINPVRLRPNADNILPLRLLKDVWQVQFGETTRSHSSTKLVPYELIGTVAVGGTPVDSPIVTIRHMSKVDVVEWCQGDERGRYTFFVYDKGPWTLTAEGPGLTTYTKRDLLLEARQRLTFDVQLDGAR